MGALRIIHRYLLKELVWNALVSLVVVAGILVPLADAGWDLGFFAIGFWFGIAVAVLGLLGSLKALVTRPKVAP